MEGKMGKGGHTSSENWRKKLSRAELMASSDPEGNIVAPWMTPSCFLKVTESYDFSRSEDEDDDKGYDAALPVAAR